jgi:glutamate carboxypeptidase
MRELLKFCEAQQPWLLQTIRALVSIESPTHNKPAVDACGGAIHAILEQSGATVTRIAQPKAGDHLFAEWGSRSGKPVLILGHFDTVWDIGQLAAMPLREDDGRLHGPGVFDMKAGISLGVQAIRALADTGVLADARVAMLLTTDEETGSESSRAIIETEARKSRAVLVLEPSLPGGAVKTGRKGCGGYDLTVHGVAAHAGIDPRKGASAIRELARQVLRIETLQDFDRGVTINIGTIQGGTRANVVPDLARAAIDVRVPTMADAATIDAALRALKPEIPGTTLEITGSIDRPPLERSDAVLGLYEQARQVAAELGHGLGEGTTGGGSDGNFTAALGIPTLDGLGAIGDGAHALHEHVVVADLPWRAALIAGLIARLSTTH